MSSPAREAAFRSLVRCEKEGRYSNIELDQTLKKNDFSPEDRGLYTRLVYGVIEKKLTLDYFLSALSTRPAESLDPSVRTLLRLGLCQILFFDRIPQSAAVNESVELAKRYCKSAAGFVNAVLRSACRQSETLAYPSKETDPAFYLSVRYSFPRWLCESFLQDYGFDRAQSLFDAFDRVPAMTLRVNTLRAHRETLLQRLAAEGYTAEKTPYSPDGIRLNAAVSEFAPLQDGLCFVQDEASQICARVLGAEPGDTVFDACACPGGKSFGIAMQMQNQGCLRSFDLHENKLSLINKGAARLGITIIQSEKQDGRQYREDLRESADRILCDLPCSGLGVMAKKPDLRYKKKEDLSRLPQIQLDILNNQAAYLKRGGVLVFSTCTVAKQENESVFRAFLSSHTEFSPDPFTVEGEGGRLEAPEGFVTLYPDVHGTDGFFISRLRKNI